MTPRRRHGDRATRRFGPALAYLLIVAVALVGFLQFEQEDTESQRQRDRLCAEAKVNREALRQVYVDVANLGRQLVGDDDPMTDAAQRARLDAFERERLANLPPITECEERR